MSYQRISKNKIGVIKCESTLIVLVNRDTTSVQCNRCVRRTEITIFVTCHPQYFFHFVCRWTMVRLKHLYSRFILGQAHDVNVTTRDVGGGGGINWLYLCMIYVSYRHCDTDVSYICMIKGWFWVAYLNFCYFIQFMNYMFKILKNMWILSCNYY